MDLSPLSLHASGAPALKPRKLDGRGAVAEMLAERLKERRHARARNVVSLADPTRRGKGEA
jgi:hypothetical protein